MLTVLKTRLGRKAAVFVHTLLASSLLTAMMPSFALEVNNEERQKIESVISTYLLEHPEIIMEALNRLELKQKELQAQLVKDSGNTLRTNSDLPMRGDATARNYIVEVFDFNCGYCKYVEPFLEELVADEKNSLQVIYVNYPVIAKSSARLASVAQAVFNLNPESYFKLHRVLMSKNIDADNTEALKDLVKEAGVDWQSVADEIKSARPQQILQQNMELGRALMVSGTPYFIINGTEHRGAFQSVDDLKALLNK